MQRLRLVRIVAAPTCRDKHRPAAGLLRRQRCEWLPWRQRVAAGRKQQAGQDQSGQNTEQPWKVSAQETILSVPTSNARYSAFQIISTSSSIAFPSAFESG